MAGLAAAISSCAPNQSKDERAAASRCWSLDRVNVRLGDLALVTPVFDRRDGRVGVRPAAEDQWIRVPDGIYAKRRTALFLCQDRRFVPAQVNGVSVQLEAGRLYPGSPFFRRIGLIAPLKRWPPPDLGGVSRAAVAAARLEDVTVRTPTALVPFVTYRFAAAGVDAPLYVRCNKDAPSDPPPRNWAGCSAEVGYRGQGLAIDFIPTPGRVADEAPAAVAAVLKFLDTLISKDSSDASR